MKTQHLLHTSQRKRTPGPEATGGRPTIVSDGDPMPPEQDKAHADRERLASDADQANSDRDTLAGNRNRQSAPDEGNSGDRDLAQSVCRDLAAPEPLETSRTRVGPAMRRDLAGDERDVAAALRDEAAELRDQAAELRDRDSSNRDERLTARGQRESRDVTRSRQRAGIGRQRARSDRADATADRSRARRDRVLAAQDRTRAIREYEVAAILRRSLLPERLPEIPNLSLAAAYLPADGELGVGGDWYDVIPVPNGCIGVAIGDVIGHGVNAAAVMGQLRSALRAYALESHPPAAVIERLHDFVAASDSPGMAGTLLFLVYEPSTGRASWVSAGHPPPLLVSPRGESRFLEGGKSTPLGVPPPQRVRETSVVLERNSTVLLYTDGLVERRGEPLDEMLTRLSGLVADGPREAEPLCEHVLAQRRNEGPLADDVALLVLRFSQPKRRFVRAASAVRADSETTARGIAG